MFFRLLLVFVSISIVSCNQPASEKAGAGLIPGQSAQEAMADPTSSAYQMQAAATTFLGSLSPELRDSGMFALADGDARTKWSNLPASMYERVGIRLGDLTDEQRRHFHNLLRASSSSQGYLKMSSLFWMEDILHEETKARYERDGGSDFLARLIESWRSENYWASFFGNPETDASWGWMITGHHLAASFTVVDNNVAFTPLFLGAEPYEVEEGTFAGWRALSHEVERGFELLHALSSDQQEVAVLDTEIPRDVLEGPGRKQSLETFQGIAGSEMNAPQQRLLNYLIHEYVKNADHDAAEQQLAKIAADGMDKVYFAWIGPTDDISKRYYYRVHGPSILIEYIRERGVGGNRGAANHIHTIVRDPQNDYGEDWLETHYEEHHSGPGGPGGPPPPPGGNN